MRSHRTRVDTGRLLGIAAVSRIVLNMNFMPTGTANTNQVLLKLTLPEVVGYKVTGYCGFDRWVLAALGTPWSPGKPVRREPAVQLAGPADYGFPRVNLAMGSSVKRRPRLRSSPKPRAAFVRC